MALVSRDYKNLKQRYDRMLDLCLEVKLIQNAVVDDPSTKDKDAKLLKALHNAEKLFSKLNNVVHNKDRDLSKAVKEAEMYKSQMVKL